MLGRDACREDCGPWGCTHLVKRPDCRSGEEGSIPFSPANTCLHRGDWPSPPACHAGDHGFKSRWRRQVEGKPHNLCRLDRSERRPLCGCKLNGRASAFHAEGFQPSPAHALSPPTFGWGRHRTEPTSKSGSTPGTRSLSLSSSWPRIPDPQSGDRGSNPRRDARRLGKTSISGGDARRTGTGIRNRRYKASSSCTLILPLGVG